MRFWGHAAAGVSSALALLCADIPLRAAETPTPVKVMIVTTFEVGADTGDEPGEFQFWVEREHLDTVVPFAFAHRHLRTDGKGVYGFVSGSSVTSGTNVLALVLDPRFDFSHTYWIVNGDAGVNPERASLGSAAWANWVINGDMANEVDSSEKPPSWPYGIHALTTAGPNVLPEEYKRPPPSDLSHEPRTMAFRINPSLVQWAYELTKDTEIPDTDLMKLYRAQYVGYPNAQRPPFVLKGDFVSTGRYYYGNVMNRWADDWAKLWTQGQARFVMAACEDQSIAYALFEASRAGRVDWNRVLFLRTASDFVFAPANRSPQENLDSGYPGYLPSLEAAHRVGSRVLHELMNHWSTYEASPPTAPSR